MQEYYQRHRRRLPGYGWYSYRQYILREIPPNRTRVVFSLIFRFRQV